MGSQQRAISASEGSGRRNTGKERDDEFTSQHTEQRCRQNMEATESGRQAPAGAPGLEI